MVCDSGYVVHASRFAVSAAVLAAIVVGVCGAALANFLLQGMVRLWRCPLRLQLFPVSALIAPSVSRIFNEVWVWMTLSQVVRAAWAAAAFAFEFLEFVVGASAAAAFAGAWIVFMFPGGVYGAAAAWMSVVTLGGSFSTSFHLMVMVYAGTAMFSSVFLYNGRTASGTASGCGTLVFPAAASVGFFTFVVGNPQRVDVVQQQAAASGGHCA